MEKQKLKNDRELKEYIEQNFEYFFDGKIKNNVITMLNGERFKIIIKVNCTCS